MKYLITIVLFGFILISCEKNKGSGDARILDYSVSDLNRSNILLDNIYIDHLNHTISLLFADSIPPDSLPMQFTATFNLSEGAKSIPVSGETVSIESLNERFVYNLTAEDGTKISYGVVLRDNQIPGGNFEDWYFTKGMNGQMYKEPGISADVTVWATANQGTSIYGAYGTIPFIIGENTAAKVMTGETSAVPVTSGTLFTGKFDINGAINDPVHPKKAVHFGIPFVLRPDAIKFSYTYQPGSRYVKATLKNPSSIFGGFTVTDIPGSDQFTAYAILEAREGENITEIARAEIISGDAQSVMKEISLPFIYVSNLKPTHISVVFASSKDGDLFTGAVGSTLVVDDVHLIYNPIE